MQHQGHVPVEGHKDHYDIAKQYNLPSKNIGHNLIRQFNASASIGFLPPLRDAQRYMEKLVEAGYRFVVLTSLSTDKHAQVLRERNLIKLFGDCFAGFKAGFKGILIEHKHNLDYKGDAVIAQTWEDVFNTITTTN